MTDLYGNQTGRAFLDQLGPAAQFCVGLADGGHENRVLQIQMGEEAFGQRFTEGVKLGDEPVLAGLNAESRGVLAEVLEADRNEEAVNMARSILEEMGP